MLQIFNTLTRQKEEFVPLDSKKVGLYICGVTVYDYCHLGHARTYTSADIIIRYLNWRGYHVNHVRNITDIDDKIIKRAKEAGIDVSTLTMRYIEAMHADFSALNLLPPDHEPRATEYIPQMIKLIEKLVASEHAYVASNGDVNYAVRHFPDYGCLSHHNLDQLESGVRVEISDAKNDPLDFVLWKAAKPDEPAWDSPWGKGRPGWHIECSAMAMELLGEQFDIHAGGRDLIFPHHENEIAQSQAVTGKNFANVWMHGGFLQVEKEKMSKSLGNFVTIRDLINEHDPEVLRYFLIASQYRSPLLYTADAIHQTKQSLTRLYTAMRGLPQSEAVSNSSFEERFIAAMDDDFNTPIALSVLFDLAHEIARLRENEAKAAAAYAELLKKLGGVLGILQSDAEAYFQAGDQDTISKVEALIAERQAARAAKNWAESDRLRAELVKLNVIVEDGSQGGSWKFAR